MKEEKLGKVSERVMGAIAAIKEKLSGPANKNEDNKVDLLSIVKKLSKNREKTKKKK